MSCARERCTADSDHLPVTDKMTGMSKTRSASLIQFGPLEGRNGKNINLIEVLLVATTTASVKIASDVLARAESHESGMTYIL